MKYIFFVGFVLSFSAAHALTLKDVILAEDVMEGPAYSFPCSKYIDVISCGRELVLEKGCRETLKVEKQTLSCRSVRGDVVIFAKVLTESRFSDETLGGVNGYVLQFSERVSLVTLQTPNGNTEHQIIVK